MRWVVTGGCGFIGTNVVTHLLKRGDAVVIIDDLSRDGSELNAEFLRERFSLIPIEVDVADQASLHAALDAQESVDAIAHLAGQVSFLASLDDPRKDFEVNAGGTLNVLEWARLRSPHTAVIGMSSNKIYGDLETLHYEETATRFRAVDYPHGFDESLPLEFRGPYGCSKGAADQYLADYGRIFGLRTASLRQSSVYGPHQHPRSDQGWVAHLMQEAWAGESIQLNGIGKQVRDLLHATDLAQLFPALETTLQPGEPAVINVGGGEANAMSILEFFTWFEKATSRPVAYQTGPLRPSDQKVFISDNTRVTALTGWSPAVSVESGLQALLHSMK
jgi:CDP-paratose 2-epimerase